MCVLIVDINRHQKGEDQEHRRDQARRPRKRALHRRRDDPDGAIRPHHCRSNSTTMLADGTRLQQQAASSSNLVQ